ncbi:Phosphinothricin N-acetyltransferase [Burkholderia sp. AD24]|nr:Phosphinothricin N-acetyltransferase [Burkholderia sp. AD24]
MQLRIATSDDARAIAAIYAPVVADTAVSFELEPPTEAEMHRRLVATLRRFPWLVSLDDAGLVSGYAYAGAHRERQAYQWSVDTTVYVRAASRGRGVGRGLYEALLAELTKLGYAQAFAGIALPNAASVARKRGASNVLTGGSDRQTAARS